VSPTGANLRRRVGAHGVAQLFEQLTMVQQMRNVSRAQQQGWHGLTVYATRPRASNQNGVDYSLTRHEELALRHWSSFLWFVALASCDRGKPSDRAGDREESAAALDTLAVAPAWAVRPSSDNLRCTPAVLRRGDVLTMNMSLPHGPTFHARSPDGTTYIVVFHGEGSPDRTRRRSLMPPDSFSRVTELRLDPSVLTAGVLVFGRDTNELLFRTPGVYRLLVGSDMETDGPSYAECLVRYVP
jgi:hypothetical protein